MKLDTFQDFPIGYEAARAGGNYRAVCTRVVDGDTYDFIVDLGLTVRVKIRVRLKDFDTAEYFHPRNQAEYNHAVAAMAFVEDKILEQPCLVKTFRTSSGSDLVTVGRYVAEVLFLRAGTAAIMWADLRIELRDNGFAKQESYA